MDVHIPSILLGLGVKCLLSWALVLIQRNHTSHRSFLGLFCMSLALVDTLLALSLSALHLQGDVTLLGLRLTRHHVCLLVQIACHTYSVLHWPVLVVTGLDHYLTLSPSSTSANWAQKIPYTVSVGLLWTLALLYVSLAPGIHPVLGNEPHHLLRKCWVFSSSSQISQVAMVLFLTVGCAMLWVHTGFATPSSRGTRPLSWMRVDTRQTDIESRKDIVRQTLWIFLNTWIFFLVFLVFCLVLPVGIPAYLGMNVPWLCFLDSFLIGVVLCIRRSPPQLQKLGPATTDIFCDWSFSIATKSTPLRDPVVTPQDSWKECG